MNEFIRELYESDMSEVMAGHRIPSLEAGLYEQEDRLTAELKERLDPNDFKLVKEYADTVKAIEREEKFYAFCCGLKYSVKFFIGVLSD